jgi:hypothetical protein
MALGSTQPLTEMSTRNVLSFRVAVICEKYFGFLDTKNEHINTVLAERTVVEC